MFAPLCAYVICRLLVVGKQKKKAICSLLLIIDIIVDVSDLRWKSSLAGHKFVQLDWSKYPVSQVHHIQHDCFARVQEYISLTFNLDFLFNNLTWFDSNIMMECFVKTDKVLLYHQVDILIYFIVYLPLSGDRWIERHVREYAGCHMLSVTLGFQEWCCLIGVGGELTPKTSKSPETLNGARAPDSLDLFFLLWSIKK
jgi:hypothetical protein